MRLNLNLTHSCNLRCTYCFAGAARESTMPEVVGREAVDRAISRALAAGRGSLEISFLGGEPLIAWDLFVDLCDHALRAAHIAGIDVSLQVTTNGTLLTDERLEALAERGVELAISLDGIPEAHDATRRNAAGRETALRVWDSLDRALSRLGRVSVVAVIDPANVRWLGESVDAFMAHGVSRIALNPNWAAAWSDGGKHAWQGGYESAAQSYLDAFRRDRPVAINVFDDKIVTRIVGASAPIQSCGFDPDDVAVAPSGRIYSCGRAVGEDLDRTQTSRAASPARAYAEPDECRRCAIRLRCASRCACSNREATGDATMPGDVLCWHERMVTPIADRVASSLYADRNAAFLRRFYERPQEETYAIRASC